MKKFFSNLICTSSASAENKRRTQGLPCPFHSDANVTHFCLFDKCTFPFVCLYCQPSHPKEHNNTYVSVSQVLHDKIIQKFKHDTNPYTESVLDTSRDTYLRIRRILISMESRVPDLIKPIKQEADEWLQILFKSYSASKKAVEKYDTLRQKNTLSIEQNVYLVRAYKVLQTNITNIKTAHKTGIDKIIQASKGAAALVFGDDKKHYLSELERIIQNRTVNFFGLKTGYKIRFSNAMQDELEECAFISKYALLVTVIKSLGSHRINFVNLGLSTYVHKMFLSSPISNLMWVKNRDLLIAGLDNGRVSIISFIVRHDSEGKLIYKSKILATLDGHKNRVCFMKYVADEQQLITADYTYTVIIWDFKKLNKSRTINLNPTAGILNNAMIYIADAKLLGYQTDSKTISFYSIKTRKSEFNCSLSKSGSLNTGPGFKYLPKSKLLVVCTDQKEIVTWRINTKNNKAAIYRIIEWQPEYTKPMSILVNEDESQLLISSSNGKLQIYAFKDNKYGECSIPDNPRTSKLILLDTFGRAFVGGGESGMTLQFSDS